MPFSDGPPRIAGELTPPSATEIAWVAFDLRDPKRRCVVQAQTWVLARSKGAAQLRLGNQLERVWAVAPREGESESDVVSRFLRKRERAA